MKKLSNRGAFGTTPFGSADAAAEQERRRQAGKATKDINDELQDETLEMSGSADERRSRFSDESELSGRSTRSGRTTDESDSRTSSNQAGSTVGRTGAGHASSQEGSRYDQNVSRERGKVDRFDDQSEDGRLSESGTSNSRTSSSTNKPAGLDNTRYASEQQQDRDRSGRFAGSTDTNKSGTQDRSGTKSTTNSETETKQGRTPSRSNTGEYSSNR